MTTLAQDLGGVVRLLEKATPGEWNHYESKYDGDVYMVQAAPPKMHVLCRYNGDGDGYTQQDVDNAAAIAAAVNFLRAHSAEIAGALAAQTTERRALLWLAGRDSGLSSQAIAYHMLGLSSNGNYPLDPSDLGRCLRMLELFPEWKPRISEMASYSKCWAGLCARWDALAAMMADEVGIDWSKGRNAPKTYQAMHAAMQQGGGGGGE